MMRNSARWDNAAICCISAIWEKVRARCAQTSGESRQAKSASTMSLSIWLARELRSGAIPAQQTGGMNVRERKLI
jgi:hypothetical protein